MADDVGIGPVRLSERWWKYGNTFHLVHIYPRTDSIVEVRDEIKYELTGCGKKVVYGWDSDGEGNYCKKCRRMRLMEELAE